MKRFLILISCALLLASCSQRRDIFNPETAKTFKQADIESPFYGNPKAKVQIVEYGDFQCPSCIRFDKLMGKKLMKDYALTGKIGITYKNFPLDGHLNAKEDALAGLCAHEQKKYWEFAEKMYALEDEKKGLLITEEERLSIGKTIGLDADRFATCIKEGRYVDKIKGDLSDGEKMSLEGTPSIYANGMLVDIQSEKQFFSIIDQLIKQ